MESNTGLVRKAWDREATHLYPFFFTKNTTYSIDPRLENKPRSGRQTASRRTSANPCQPVLSRAGRWGTVFDRRTGHRVRCATSSPCTLMRWTGRRCTTAAGTGRGATQRFSHDWSHCGRACGFNILWDFNSLFCWYPSSMVS